MIKFMCKLNLLFVFVVLLFGVWFMLLVSVQLFNVDIVGGVKMVILIVVVLFVQDGGVLLFIDIVDVMCNDFNCLGKFCLLVKSEIVEFLFKGVDIKFLIW